MKSTLITICGRAGSKGFASKNLKNFLGKPLVYYSLVAAFDFKEKANQKGQNVDICLNTDSLELIEIVKKRYPEVDIIHRPKELAGDYVAKLKVWQHSCEVMEQNKGVCYDYVIDLDITSPLRKINDLSDAFQMKADRVDSEMVFSVCESRRNPYFNMVKQVGDYVEKVIPSEFVSRQQSPELFDMNASIYVFDAAFLRENQSGMLFEAKCVAYIMDDTGILDIDSEHDFQLMQVIASYLYENHVEYRNLKDLV